MTTFAEQEQLDLAATEEELVSLVALRPVPHARLR